MCWYLCVLESHSTLIHKKLIVNLNIFTSLSLSLLLQMLLDYSGSSTDGKQLVDFLSDRTSEVMLFVPHNSGFTQNKVLCSPTLQ